VSSKSKLTKSIRKLNATWLELPFVAEIDYRDVTAKSCYE